MEALLQNVGCHLPESSKDAKMSEINLILIVIWRVKIVEQNATQMKIWRYVKTLIQYVLFQINNAKNLWTISEDFCICQ